MVDVSRNSSVISINERFRLAFIPRGGSVVSFMPFCRMATGKYDAGIEVKYSL